MEETDDSSKQIVQSSGEDKSKIKESKKLKEKDPTKIINSDEIDDKEYELSYEIDPNIPLPDEVIELGKFIESKG